MNRHADKIGPAQCLNYNIGYSIVSVCVTVRTSRMRSEACHVVFLLSLHESPPCRNFPWSSVSSSHRQDGKFDPKGNAGGATLLPPGAWNHSELSWIDQTHGRRHRSVARIAANCIALIALRKGGRAFLCMPLQHKLALLLRSSRPFSERQLPPGELLKDGESWGRAVVPFGQCWAGMRLTRMQGQHKCASAAVDG